ncbi:J domain-containing protein [Spirillospora sp. NPDC127200]
MGDSFEGLDGQDAYEILGVLEDADDREIRRAFAREVRAVHPDAVQDPDAPPRAAERLRLLKAARTALLDHRAEYDRHRAPEPAPTSTFRPNRGGMILLVVLLGYLFALAACVSALADDGGDAPEEGLAPSGYAGTWQGEMTYRDGRTATRMRLTLKPDGGTGRASYENAVCTSTLTPAERVDERVTFDERINKPENGCADSIVHTYLKGDELSLTYHDRKTGRPVAEAALRKVL